MTILVKVMKSTSMVQQLAAAATDKYRPSVRGYLMMGRFVIQCCIDVS
jgi:hypothetical protein